MLDSFTQGLESVIGQMNLGMGVQCWTVELRNWRAVSDSCTRELDSNVGTRELDNDVGQLCLRIVDQCCLVGSGNWRAVIGEQCQTVELGTWSTVSDSRTRELECSLGQLVLGIEKQCRPVVPGN
ncbi:hypothetical protein J6590_104252 [Homalodisca vitripennis]|nr:hypothetical protein J6590_104252 [Homalodisca vitripennis]